MSESGSTERRALDPRLWPDLRFYQGRVYGPDGGFCELQEQPGGSAVLVHQLGERILRLTSRRGVEEDRALVDKLELEPGEGLLCFGLGLGHYLRQLAARLEPGTQVWVLESRPELAAAALLDNSLAELFQRPGFCLFVGPFGSQAPWGPEREPPRRSFWRPATARHFASEYPFAASASAGRRSSSRPEGKLLLFQSGYYLDRELLNAARALGLQTECWHFQRGLTGSAENYCQLLELIKSFRPDMALTVNHLGFDAQGLLDDIFTRLHLPVVSWFVDSPPFILAETKPGPFTLAASWDKDYLAQLRAVGFQRVCHLPLASDETFFFPRAQKAGQQRELAFVGDSLSAATDKYLTKLGLGPGPQAEALLVELDGAAADFLQQGRLLPEPELTAALARTHGLFATPAALSDLAALITWRASRLWRLRVLSALPQGHLTVAGSPDWPELLPACRAQGPLDYYQQVPDFFSGSQININVTSAQMKNGLNQRIFDVPACGAFLLTDRREQIFELFDEERELVLYREPDEARELALWYLKHPCSRRRVAAAAHRRVMDQHLYRHRLAWLWAWVKNESASGAL